MPVPSPFHERTFELCTSYRWTDWAGHYAVSSYNSPNDSEYYSLRHAAAVIDISPLFKYEVSGADAAVFLSRIMTKNIEAIPIGRAVYCCWCDDFGKIIDDGTVFRLDAERLRVHTAEPMLAWFEQFKRNLNVTVKDITTKTAALAVQGPTSRKILNQISDMNLEALAYYHIMTARLDNVPVLISRTGYTGDLGYEIWVEHSDALPLWDALMAAGKPYLLQPFGLDVLDIARIEAGLILNGIEFHNAAHCLVESQKSTPFELGLGWTVDLEREPFCGQQALKAEQAAGSQLAIVGLELDWDEQEALYAKHGLPVLLNSGAWRSGVPVYDGDGGRQIGKATSGAWSPMIKKNLALASVETAYADIGTTLKMEYTVEYRRETVTAKVAPMPFYNPEHKKI
ncbi:MAG: aminomethyltransferase family protein [Desulfobacterales bacterium]|nr:aminomethyltransferase family protein [Desulfobacterales bacterium]